MKNNIEYPTSNVECRRKVTGASVRLFGNQTVNPCPSVAYGFFTSKLDIECSSFEIYKKDTPVKSAYV